MNDVFTSEPAPERTEKVTEAEFFALRMPGLLLPEAQRRVIFPHFESLSFPKDTVIFDTRDAKGQPKGLYIVVTGEVDVHFSRSSRAVDILGPGGLFGAPILYPPGKLPFSASSTVHTRVLLLRREVFEANQGAIFQAVPGLERSLRLASDLSTLQPTVIAALARTSSFTGTSPRQIADILSRCELVEAEAGTTIVHQDTPARGLYYVLAGEVRMDRLDKGANETVAIDFQYPGDCFGDVALLVPGGIEPANAVVTRGPARLIHVPAQTYREQLEASLSMRRRIVPGFAQVSTLAETAVLFSNLEVPLSLLTSLLAETLVADHADRVLIMSLPAPAPGDRPGEQPVPGPGGVDRLRLPVPSGMRAAAAVAPVVADLMSKYDVILFDTCGRRDMMATLDERVVRRLIYLTDDTFGSIPSNAPGGARVIYSALLGRTRLPPTGRPYRSGTVRLRLDLDWLGRQRDLTLAGLSAPARATFSRWGRALTDRRVGVALGGGGSWGYAHVPLIRTMLGIEGQSELADKTTIPIDMVSGASFGAVVAGYYSALAARRGDPFEAFMAGHQKLQKAMNWGMLSGRAIESMIDDETGHQRLEDLEIPFFPCATSLNTGALRAITRGTVGVGVRASGSFPGLFPTTAWEGHHFVDGCITNNVPDDVLVPEGAYLLIASNICSKPADQPASPPTGRLRSLLEGLNPIHRARTAFRSSLIMLHAIGEDVTSWADVVFEPPPVQWMFWDMSHAKEIADAAKPEAIETMIRIQAKWSAMRPRRT